MADSTWGFIILRCIRQKGHNLLFKECYDCIRRFYDNKIVIIDDNSDQTLVDSIELKNAVVVNSEFPGRGEILPYYYFYHMRPFDKAVILHDSMFIKAKIDFGSVKDMKYIWYFDDHQWDEVETEIKLVQNLTYVPGLIEKYVSRSWYGCFGAAAVISYGCVKQLHDKYNLFALLPLITTRKDRMAFERIIGLLSRFENVVPVGPDCSISGRIHDFPCAFQLNFETYKRVPPSCSMVKVWSGR